MHDAHDAHDAHDRGNGAGAGGPVLEWAPFRLAPEADETALLAAADAVQREFLDHQPGFVRRELLRDDAGRWADVLTWTDAAAARAAMAAVGATATGRAYFALMTFGHGPAPDGGMLHLARVRAWPSAGAAA